ncbi:MAG TPA: Tm-1-like ATP-binding domain-containing protein [Feifaniaceae bacterium]|nr:Tm-1-like ATP-binding domain-containing protein [Feifaniaceae bacterium]
MNIFTVAIVATCDTKGNEANYLRERVQSYGMRGLILDCGILRDPPEHMRPDISKHEVAGAAGYTIAQLIERGSRGAAVDGMIEGVNAMVSRLYQGGLIHALIAIGGAEGALLARAGMDALPLFVPKLTLSPVASGSHKFEEIIGYNDAMAMHTVVDILGLNSISKRLFDNAVGAIVGMLQAHREEAAAREAVRVGITAAGTVTPPLVKTVLPTLQEKGFEVYSFHSNGVGGPCMDNLVREGIFHGILEYSLSEIVGNLYGGLHKSKADRMEAAVERGIPLLVVPGVSTLLVLSTADAATPAYQGRKHYYHNREITLVNLNDEECAAVAAAFVEILNRAQPGKAALMFPTLGLASQDKDGCALENPSGREAMLRVIRTRLAAHIPLIVLPMHINDDAFAAAVAEKFLSLQTQAEAPR